MLSNYTKRIVEGFSELVGHMESSPPPPPPDDPMDFFEVVHVRQPRLERIMRGDRRCWAQRKLVQQRVKMTAILSLFKNRLFR